MDRSCRFMALACRFLITGYLMSLASGMPSAEFFKIQHFSEKKRDSISFLAIGDWGRNGRYNQTRVATQMGVVGRKMDIDFVISTGDNFYDEGLKSVNDPSFQTSFTDVYTARSLQKPWYAVLGNHDYMRSVEAQMSPALRRRDKRWHCHRNFIVKAAGLVDIIFIDTTPFLNKYTIKRKKFDWTGILPREKYLSELLRNLNSTLKESNAPWKVVVGHHPIRSIGSYGDTLEIVTHVLPILEANKVSMYTNGHAHCLEHITSKKGTSRAGPWRRSWENLMGYDRNNVQFITSGGGSSSWNNEIQYNLHTDTKRFYYDGNGFVSVELVREKASITFFDINGNRIYSLKIK